MFHKILLFCLVYLVGCDKPVPVSDPKRDYSKFHTGALSYCKDKGFNQEYYFLIDLSIHSGKNRFFVYDFNQRKFTDQKLVSHGSCDADGMNPTKWEKAKFSNASDSHCSATGKYKIGKRDWSGWGIKIKYWLHGLEPTNNNAEKRVIVLHSWEAVSDKEVFPRYSPLSWGCPAVSDDFMAVLEDVCKKVRNRFYCGL